ncbi:hypothetical protein [Methylorubrum salsuginis]|uniref:Uncharacterized protein n=1 Tax=Methylorubrum salsuginis TaxID=414703 RepID=A0A1I4E5X2_9HYPH|nr:hypothetical protein [Methylorubrum salsuginis]SFL00340.1 hypothetical protein SAMN04488125_10769 [Methylorubrum salsuginis]
MPAWKTRPITPNFLPFGDNGLTYDPKLVVETQRVAVLTDLFDDPLLQDAPLTKPAPLTKFGRDLIKSGTVKAFRARLPDAVEHCALVIKIAVAETDAGKIVSASPERAALYRRDRWLIVTRRVVVTAPGYEDRAFSSLADLLAGTTHRNGEPKPYRAPPVHQDDMDALRHLAP